VTEEYDCYGPGPAEEPDDEVKKGNTRHVPTEASRALVTSYAAVSTSQDDIAFIVGISDNTLRKYYAMELRAGLIKAKAAVSKSLFELATGKEGLAPSVQAITWWEKTRAGMKDTTKHELGGVDGKAIVFQTVDDEAL
jgi:hypothetical protein